METKTTLMPGPCPKCGGTSRFYHLKDDTTRGYVKCDECHYKQKKVLNRSDAIMKWNDTTPTKKRIWDNFEVVGEVRKSDCIKFVLAAATRDGFRYINIREFYLRKRDNTWQPGRDGITIPLVAPLNKGEQFIKPYNDMIKTLGATAKLASTMDLLNEANSVWIEKKDKKEQKGPQASNED